MPIVAILAGLTLRRAVAVAVVAGAGALLADRAGEGVRDTGAGLRDVATAAAIGLGVWIIARELK